MKIFLNISSYIHFLGYKKISEEESKKKKTIDFKIICVQ